MSGSRSDVDDAAAIVDRVARARHTVKVLAGAPLDVVTDRETVEALVATAGWAPFHLVSAAIHRDGAELPGIVPWRWRLLDVSACRALRDWLLAREEPSTYPRLLAAATALAVVTWLPDPPAEASEDASVLFAGTQHNMEHLAAAAAAVQTFLLAATARGIPTFWASGGPLRAPDAFARLGIPARERLLGAVFLFPAEPSDAEVKVSMLRERRGAPAEWSRWVEPPPDDGSPAAEGDR